MLMISAERRGALRPIGGQVKCHFFVSEPTSFPVALEVSREVTYICFLMQGNLARSPRFIDKSGIYEGDSRIRDAVECASYQTQKTSPKRPGFFQLLFEYPSIREPGLRVQTLPTCPSKYISQTVPTVNTIFDGFSSSELADVRHGHNFINLRVTNFIHHSINTLD